MATKKTPVAVLRKEAISNVKKEKKGVNNPQVPEQYEEQRSKVIRMIPQPYHKAIQTGKKKS